MPSISCPSRPLPLLVPAELTNFQRGNLAVIVNKALPRACLWLTYLTEPSRSCRNDSLCRISSSTHGFGKRESGPEQVGRMVVWTEKLDKLSGLCEVCVKVVAASVLLYDVACGCSEAVWLPPVSSTPTVRKMATRERRWCQRGFAMLVMDSASSDHSENAGSSWLHWENEISSISGLNLGESLENQLFSS